MKFDSNEKMYNGYRLRATFPGRPETFPTFKSERVQQNFLQNYKALVASLGSEDDLYLTEQFMSDLSRKSINGLTDYVLEGEFDPSENFFIFRDKDGLRSYMDFIYYNPKSIKLYGCGQYSSSGERFFDLGIRNSNFLKPVEEITLHSVLANVSFEKSIVNVINCDTTDCPSNKIIKWKFNIMRDSVIKEINLHAERETECFALCLDRGVRIDKLNFTGNGYLYISNYFNAVKEFNMTSSKKLILDNIGDVSKCPVIDFIKKEGNWLAGKTIYVPGRHMCGIRKEEADLIISRLGAISCRSANKANYYLYDTRDYPRTFDLKGLAIPTLYLRQLRTLEDVFSRG